MEIEKKLEKIGSVAKVEKERIRSFDIAFAEEKAYLIKIVGNIESFTKEKAENLKKSASVANANPIVICENVKDGVAYRRHDVPIMKLETFFKYIREGEIAIADRGCIKVPVEGVKEARERENISRAELAKMLNVSTEMIRRYEEGKAYPSKEIAEKMAEILGKEIITKPKFKNLEIKRAFIGKAPFEVGIKRKRPILISFKYTKERIKNLENVSEVLKAKAVFAKKNKIEYILRYAKGF